MMNPWQERRAATVNSWWSAESYAAVAVVATHNPTGVHLLTAGSSGQALE